MSCTRVSDKRVEWASGAERRYPELVTEVYREGERRHARPATPIFRTREHIFR